MQGTAHATRVSHTLNPFHTSIANRKLGVLIYIERTANRPKAE